MELLPIAILAGGLGTRLRPITERVPKALIPVAGRPFIEHQLTLLRNAGITRAVLCVGYLGESIETRIGNGRAFGIDIAYSYDGAELIGTAGALKKAVPLLGERFFVIYGDSYLACDYADVESAFLKSGKSALMTVYENAGALAPSNVLFRAGQIEAYDKRLSVAGMQHIDFGLSAFHCRALDNVPENRPSDLATVFQHLLECGDLAAYEVTSRFYEVGTPEAVSELEHVLGRSS